MSKLMKIIGVLMAVCLLSVPFLSASGLNGDTAENNAVYILGDADGDGEVTVVDATIIQRVLANFDFTRMDLPEGMDAEKFLAGVALRGDVDDNGDLESIDVTFILRYNVFMRTPYPIGEEIYLPTEPPTEAPEPTQSVTEAPTAAPTQRPTAKPDPYELPPI